MKEPLSIYRVPLAAFLLAAFGFGIAGGFVLGDVVDDDLHGSICIEKEES